MHQFKWGIVMEDFFIKIYVSVALFLCAFMCGLICAMLLSSTVAITATVIFSGLCGSIARDVWVISVGWQTKQYD